MDMATGSRLAPRRKANPMQFPSESPILPNGGSRTVTDRSREKTGARTPGDHLTLSKGGDHNYRGKTVAQSATVPICGDS